MHLIKKTISFTGNVVGTFVEYKIKLLAYTIGAIGKLSNKEEVYIKSKTIGNSVGEKVGNSIKVTSNIVGTVADKSIDLTCKAANCVSKNVVKTKVTMYGDSKKFYKNKNFINAEYKIQK